jgi:hypothetical protein
VGNLRGTLAILLGKGDGTFRPAATYNVAQSPQSILVTDMNGDGIVDLTILDSQAAGGYDKVWVAPGKADGSFGTPIGTLTGTVTGYLAHTDLNHDGHTDLVIADPFTSGIAVLFGKGDGTFQPPKLYAAGAQGKPTSVGVIPLGDGNTALFTIDFLTGDILLTFASSDGTVSSPLIQFVGTTPSGLAVADLDGDSQPDLAISDSSTGSLYVLRSTGNGQFGVPVPYTLGRSPGAVAFVDVNHDGKPDAIVANTDGIDVLLGKGDGTFGAARTFASAGQHASIFENISSLATADLNSDGNVDVVAANTGSGGLSVFLGNGDGSFRPASAAPLPSGVTPVAAVVGDLNGDGKPDLLAAYIYPPPDGVSFSPPPGGIRILLGNGDGTFSPAGDTAFAGSVMSAGLADLNGDGILDAVVSSPGRCSPPSP